MSALLNALLEKGLVNKDQLDDARDKQIGAKKPIHELLIEMGFVEEKALVEVASEVFDMTVSVLETEEIDPSAIKLLPYESAKKYGVFPVREENNKLIIAMTDPRDIIALDDLGLITGKAIKPVLSTRVEIERFIEEKYQSDDSLYDLLKNITVEGEVKRVEAKEYQKDDISDIAVENSPIVKLVSLIFSDALKERASDIHIDPQEEFTEVRYRIDGDLRSVMKVPAKLQSALVSRIKILSELNIAEKMKPQDGRTKIAVAGREVDVRVSTSPTVHGETVVLRLLGTGEAKTELDKIGLEKEEQDILEREIQRTQGMILVTGPTGSGKTSTLYAALNYRKSEATNIITIEDPIEYLLEGANQIQINPKKDVTFATGLRNILRQDPNVILVGEIRDRETADMAFRAALTGHLLLSTLHTNNAIATITRLKDIGLEEYVIASSIILVVAQRLVKVICPHCKEEYTPSAEGIEMFGEYIDKYAIGKHYKGKGCEKCSFSGYLGRTAIFEMFEFNEDIRKLISEGASEDIIFKAAKKHGMRPLAESGVKKVAEGITTLEELAKAVDIGERATAAEEPARELPLEREKPLVLIVDDEDDIRKVVSKRLTIAGYDVIVAKNGKEGVEEAAREKPDLIVMDVMMPVMDGFEATKELRSRLETAVIPIMMLTAKRDKDSELAGLESGADDYITKPFDSEKLIARIKMLLKRAGR